MIRQQNQRSQKPDSQVQQRRQQNRIRNQQSKETEPFDNGHVRLTLESTSRAKRRQLAIDSTNLQLLNPEDGTFISIHSQLWANVVLNYKPTINYTLDKNACIERMHAICRFCFAKKWDGETLGMCYSGEKNSIRYTC